MVKVEDSCPVCHSSEGMKTVWNIEDMITQRPFSIVECPHCTMMRTLPVPDHLGAFYDSDMGRMMVTAPSKTHAFLKGLLLGLELRRIISRVSPATFVDVGCGPGDFACFIHRKGHSVMTADAGEEPPSAVQASGSIPYYPIDFDRCEIRGLERFPSSTVILRHVLEHVRNPKMFLEKLIQYGASHFYIVVPNTACLERRILGRYWGFWDPPRHLWHYNHRALRFLLESLDLTIMAQGFDTIPNIIPSFYRYLRVKGVSPLVYNLFKPKGFLSSVSTPLNLFLPKNVAWILVSVKG
ncbi:MAG TPA: class I SAM-dependent methyltransferase [Nitrospiria bacterium]|jgi:hypothetical protein